MQHNSVCFGLQTMMLLTCDAWLKNPQNVTSPSDFLPERWLRNVSGKREQPIPTVAFLPFGINTRNCMGRRFAEQIIFLAVAKVWTRFVWFFTLSALLQIILGTRKKLPIIFYMTSGLTQWKKIIKEKEKLYVVTSVQSSSFCISHQSLQTW